MNRVKGKQPMPSAVLTLLIAIEGMEVPDNIHAVLTSIQVAIFDKNPRAALNKRGCRLREARPGIFREVWKWLKVPEVLRAVRRSGAYWAWKIWCRACAVIDRGGKPHVAFGMNKPGRPVQMHFSAADDAAMYAEYLHQCLNVPSEKAGERALGMIGNGYEGDRRTIQRLRKNYTSCGATLLVLPDELRMKYPEFKE